MNLTLLDDDPNFDRLGPPRRAALEFPDQEAVTALGLDLPLEEARLVLVVLSRYLATSKAKTRSYVHPACAFLALACTLALERDGDIWAPAHPELADGSWPCAVTGLAWLEIDHLDLADYWRVAKDRADDSCYPLEWIRALFPAAIWPAVMTLIRWGPERAQIMFEEAAMASARTPLKRTSRRRPTGSLLALGTVGDDVQRFGIENAHGGLGEKARQGIVDTPLERLVDDDRRSGERVRRLRPRRRSRIPLLVPGATEHDQEQRRDERAGSEPHRALTIASPRSRDAYVFRKSTLLPGGRNADPALNERWLDVVTTDV